jgi:hypothetical protein
MVNQQLVNYIKAHRSDSDLKSLKKSLIGEGYDPNN